MASAEKMAFRRLDRIRGVYVTDIPVKALWEWCTESVILRSENFLELIFENVQWLPLEITSGWQMIVLHYAKRESSDLYQLVITGTFARLRVNFKRPNGILAIEDIVTIDHSDLTGMRRIIESLIKIKGVNIK